MSENENNSISNDGDLTLSPETRAAGAASRLDRFKSMKLQGKATTNEVVSTVVATTSDEAKLLAAGAAKLLSRLDGLHRKELLDAPTDTQDKKEGSKRGSIKDMVGALFAHNGNPEIAFSIKSGTRDGSAGWTVVIVKGPKRKVPVRTIEAYSQQELLNRVQECIDQLTQ